MLLMSIEAWTRKYFAPESRPDDSTVRKWLRKGEIDGARKVGGTWYIDEHAWCANGDELVKRVLENS